MTDTCMHKLNGVCVWGGGGGGSDLGRHTDPYLVRGERDLALNILCHWSTGVLEYCLVFCVIERNSIISTVEYIAQ